MKQSKKIIFIFFFIFLNFKFVIAEEKVAFINIDLVFQNSIEGKGIAKKLEVFKKEKMNTLKAKENEILKNEKKLLNQKNVLTKEEFDTKVKDLRKEIALFEDNRKKFSLEFEEKKNEELKIFMKSIRPVIEDYIKKNSISIVLNQKNLFIADKKYDITNDILKILNKDS